MVPARTSEEPVSQLQLTGGFRGGGAVGSPHCPLPHARYRGCTHRAAGGWVCLPSLFLIHRLEASRAARRPPPNHSGLGDDAFAMRVCTSCSPRARLGLSMCASARVCSVLSCSSALAFAARCGLPCRQGAPAGRLLGPQGHGAKHPVPRGPRSARAHASDGSDGERRPRRAPGKNKEKSCDERTRDVCVQHARVLPAPRSVLVLGALALRRHASLPDKRSWFWSVLHPPSRKNECRTKAASERLHVVFISVVEEPQCMLSGGAFRSIFLAAPSDLCLRLCASLY